MVLRPLWFVTFGPSPAFSAIVLINELSLFWPTADFLNQGLEDSCFVQLFIARQNGASLSFISVGRFFAYNW